MIELEEEFYDYLNNLPKELQAPFEIRKEDPENLVPSYIGILPLISVKKPKYELKNKDIYSQYRKNYLSDLTKLVETYFPPLQVMMLPPMQVTKYDLETFKKVDSEKSYIINPDTLKAYPVKKIIGRMNVFDMARAIRPTFHPKCTTVSFHTTQACLYGFYRSSL